MKKNIYLVLSLPLLLLVSCQGSKGGSKVKLSYGSLYDEGALLISEADFKEKIDGKESFIISLIPGEESDVSCGCYRTFSYVIDNFVKDTHFRAYKTNVYEISEYGVKTPANEDPGFAIFKDGKLFKQYRYSVSNTPTYFTNVDSFTSLINETCLDPNMFYINDEQYLSKLTNKEDFVMSIVRKGCGDCKYMLPNILDPFFKSKDRDVSLYLLDIEDLGHYKKKTDGDEQYRSYIEYKKSIGLGPTYNPIFGYDTDPNDENNDEGVVPTTFVYEDGEIIDGEVFFNDSVSKVNDEYVISTSYYTEERVANLNYTNTVLQNKKLGEDEVAVYGEFVYMPSSSASVYHTPILNEFLNYYF